MAAEWTPRAIVALYPELGDVIDPAGAMPAGCALVEAAAGTTLFSESDPCRGFPLVLEGEVRVAQVSPEGRSLELYRVVPGDICVVSSACLFRSQPVTARGMALAPTTLALVTPSLFSAWLADTRFRNYILGPFAQRMAELSAVVEALAFQRVDQRLAGALLGHGQELCVTHQQLAERLGTVREIVTRMLRRFERAGWIEHSRERIRIVDSAALRQLAGRL